MSKAKEIYMRVENEKATPEILAALGDLYEYAVRLEGETPLAPEDVKNTFVSGGRLGNLSSFVLGDDPSTMDLPAQQDCLREIRRLRTALFWATSHLPASGAEMSASEWNIWLLCERALHGEAELPDYVSPEIRAAVLEVDAILYG